MSAHVPSTKPSPSAETILSTPSVGSADVPLGLTRFEYRVLKELNSFDGPAAPAKVARRFLVSERPLVLPALNSLVRSGMCRHVAGERFALALGGDIVLS